MIKIGDRLPEATLSESIEFGDACPMSPKSVKVSESVKGKKIIIFGLPGAYTPTCSAKHVPGYVDHIDDFHNKGVHEVWCIAVNDGYVMAAWGQDQDSIGKVRMLGDGSAELTKKLGLDIDIPGMGVRIKRCSMLIEDGVVTKLNVEAPGKFTVSDAATMLKSLG